MFSEVQYDNLLELSFSKSGTMKYIAPNYFAQFYETPQKGQMIYRDTGLDIDFPDKKLTLDSSNYPQISSFSSSILHILNGNKAALEQDFILHFSPSEANHWELVLTPKQLLAKYMKQIVIKGKLQTINSLKFTQHSGDWRELTLTPFTPIDARQVP